MKRIREKFTKQVFDGLVGIILVLYSLGILIQVVLMEIVQPSYIFTYKSWSEILLAFLIMYVSKERVKNIKW